MTEIRTKEALSMFYKMITLIFLLGSLAIANMTAKIIVKDGALVEQSIEKVKASLPKNKRDEFKQALNKILLSNKDIRSLIMTPFGADIDYNEKEVAEFVYENLNGKTGLEIIDFAKQIGRDEKPKNKEFKPLTEERKKEIIEQARREEKAAIRRMEGEYELPEMEDLQYRREMVNKNKKLLIKFKILSSKFSKRKQSEYDLMESPIITLTVKNETKYPLSRVYFEGVLQSEGRSIPWLKKDFNYEISGGIEPGEILTWHLSPGLFSSWATLKAPKEAILKVIVKGFDGPSLKPSCKPIDFSPEDEARLEELERKYSQ